MTDDQNIKAVSDLIKKIREATSSADIAKAGAELIRHGKSLSDKELDVIIACGCGPHGERGIESGLCST